MYHSIRRLSYLVTFLTETADPIDLTYEVDVHGTSRSVIGYIILTFQVIKDHLWTKNVICEIEEKNWVSGGTPFCPLFIFLIQNHLL